MHQIRKPTWKEKLERSGYFFAALFFHIIVFLMVATVIVFQAPKPPVDTEFQAVHIQAPPPPPVPPPSGEASKTAAEPQPVLVPPSTPQHIISNSQNTSFQVDTTKVVANALSHISVPPPQSTGMSQGAGNLSSALGTSSVFGSTTGSSTQLQGILFDLKQTVDRKPTGVDAAKYHDILIKFVDRRWDESVLAPYYRSAKPLYSTGILIPMMPAILGPKAFGLEKEVEPGRWIVWYKGKVSPPAAGRYRFVGLADDILLVRVDGKTVLDGSLFPVDKKKQVTPWKPIAGRWGLRQGEDITFSSGEMKDIDIIIGEQPGGQFFASLFAMKDGETYPTKDGQPVLPLFQIGPDFKLPTGVFPPVNPIQQPWQGSSR